MGFRLNLKLLMLTQSKHLMKIIQSIAHHIAIQLYLF